VSSTDTSNFGSNDGQGSSPDTQDSSLPLFDIFGGVLCTIGFLFLLFMGWRQLRKYLLPEAPVKLPPSGASPWSRERQDSPWQQTDHSWSQESIGTPWQQTATPWQQMSNNSGFTPPGPAVANGYGPQTSMITPAQGIGNGLPPYQTQFPQPDYAGSPPAYGMDAQRVFSAVPMAGDFAPSNGNVPPVTDSFAAIPRAAGPEKNVRFEQATHSLPMDNNNNALSFAPPIMNGQPVMNGQWTGSLTKPTADFNDPYLLGTIRQYREKGRASGQQPNS